MPTASVPYRSRRRCSAAKKSDAAAAKKIPLDIALFHVAMPYAGTEFYFQAVANGWEAVGLSV